MYSLKEGQTHIELSPGEVLEVYASVNRIPIAAEGHDQQEARAFFCSGNGSRGINAFVYLMMLSDNEALIYPWDEPIAKSDYLDVRAAGLQFCESMGFMMEDWQLRQQTTGERKRIWDETSIFRPLPVGPVVEQPQVLESESEDERTEEYTIDEAPRQLPPDETILDLALDASATQVVYTEKAPPPPQDEGDPLEDKNFKVFLRLLTSA